MFDLKKLGSKADEFVGLLSDGMTLIAGLTGNATADNAADILTVIKVVVASLQKAYAGKVTPEAVRAEWHKFQSSIADNDARAEAALREKFDKSDG